MVFTDDRRGSQRTPWAEGAEGWKELSVEMTGIRVSVWAQSRIRAFIFFIFFLAQCHSSRQVNAFFLPGFILFHLSSLSTRNQYSFSQMHGASSVSNAVYIINDDKLLSSKFNSNFTRSLWTPKVHAGVSWGVRASRSDAHRDPNVDVVTIHRSNDDKWCWLMLPRTWALLVMGYLSTISWDSVPKDIPGSYIYFLQPLLFHAFLCASLLIWWFRHPKYLTRWNCSLAGV